MQIKHNYDKNSFYTFRNNTNKIPSWLTERMIKVFPSPYSTFTLESIDNIENPDDLTKELKYGIGNEVIKRTIPENYVLCFSMVDSSISIVESISESFHIMDSQEIMIGESRFQALFGNMSDLFEMSAIDLYSNRKIELELLEELFTEYVSQKHEDFITTNMDTSDISPLIRTTRMIIPFEVTASVLGNNVTTEFKEYFVCGGIRYNEFIYIYGFNMALDCYFVARGEELPTPLKLK